MVYVINDEHLTRRKLVTMDGSKVTTETDIPLGLNINLPGVKAAGADVRLSKLDGTPLAREIECKDVPNTDDIMIWYQWDTTASQNDQIYVYWGNSNLTEPASNSTYGSEAVWDVNYLGVWHMNNDPNGDVADSIKDSTSNDNHGSPHGGMTTADLVDDDYGKAIRFDGNDYLSMGVLNIADDKNYNYMIQLKTAGAGVDAYIMSEGNTGDNNPIVGLISNGDNPRGFYRNNAGVGTIITGSTALDDSALHTISHDGDGTTMIIYADGGSEDSGAIPATPTTFNTFTIGALNRAAISNYYTGDIMLARVSDISRSANYILTTHKNINNPTDSGSSPFYLSFSSAQHQRRTPTIL